MTATAESLAQAFAVYRQARAEGVEHDAAVTTAMYEVRTLSENELRAYVAGVTAQPSESRSELRRVAALGGACPICHAEIGDETGGTGLTTEAQMVVGCLADRTVAGVIGLRLGLPIADVEAAAQELAP